MVRFRNKREMLKWAPRLGVAYNQAFVNNWEYYPLTWREVNARCCRFANGLRGLGVAARYPGGWISDSAGELGRSRQAFHRVVNDMVRLQMIELEDSSRRTRERIPKLIAGGRVAAWCGLRWERRWFEQLAEGGRLVIPVGPRGGSQELILATKTKGKIQQRNLLPVRFVPFTREKVSPEKP